jgi:hypothetical protein
MSDVIEIVAPTQTDVVEVVVPVTPPNQPEVLEVAVAGPQGPAGTLSGVTGSKNTPVDADKFAILDSAASDALKTLTLGNLKNALWEAKTTAFTAVSGGRYVASGTFTVTNPASGNDGEMFQVVVASGTVTVNGVAYAASRWPVTVARVSGSWTTLANSLTENLTLNGTNSTAPNQTAASSSSIITRQLLDDAFLDTRIIRFRDDFFNGGRTNGIIGETGWGTSNAGGGTLVERSTVGVMPHHTALRLTTGATAGNYLRIYTANGIFGASNPATVAGWHALAIMALPDVTNVTVSAGFSANPLDLDFNSRLIGWRFKAGVDTNWQFVTKNDVTAYASSTLTTLVDSGTAPVAGTFYKFEMRCVTAGTIEFRLNGGNWLTSSTNVPTSSNAGLFFVIVGTQTSAARTCDVDLVAWNQTVAR